MKDTNYMYPKLFILILKENKLWKKAVKKKLLERK